MWSYAHEEVVWFDVSMNKILEMDEFNTTNHWVSKHKNGLQSESSWAIAKQFFQRRSQQVNHQYFMITLGSIPF